MVCLLTAFPAPARTEAGAPFARPLSEMLRETEARFGVRIVCKGFAADTVTVTYADFRVRPYSMRETLDNLLHPLNLVWLYEPDRRQANARDPADAPVVPDVPDAPEIPEPVNTAHMPDHPDTPPVPIPRSNTPSRNLPTAPGAPSDLSPAPAPGRPGQSLAAHSGQPPAPKLGLSSGSSPAPSVPIASGQSGKIVVRPYEYYRRSPADGENLLVWLAGKYRDRASWEYRRKELLAGAREALGLDPFLQALVPEPAVRLGRIERHDGYTMQNYALETLPGLYVCGTIYAPLAPGRYPLILSPAGHWPGGRYRADQQLRMAAFARMGAVAVDTDIFGWGDSERQVGREAHTTPYAMQIQVLWSKAVTDWIIASRRDIDTARMAATGGSGGATHALLLALVDGRFKALAPVVHLVSHFDGGCPCESGRPVTLAAGGSCMPELLAAAMAPHPVLAVSDGGDWTASYPALEYPFLKRIWGFYGADAQVENVHLPDERHDYGVNKRRAVYDFFARTLGLDAARADETRVSILPESGLCSFGDSLPRNALRSRAELEQMLKINNIR